jgi:hypothetical protein
MSANDLRDYINADYCLNYLADERFKIGRVVKEVVRGKIVYPVGSVVLYRENLQLVNWEIVLLRTITLGKPRNSALIENDLEKGIRHFRINIVFDASEDCVREIVW